MPVYHPEFVHFPIALIAVSVILEFFAFFTRRPTLSAAAWWTLFAAALGGIVAVATGLYDMYVIHIDAAANRYVDFHMWVGFAVLAGAAVLAVWRGVLYFRQRDTRVPYMLAALLILGLITFQNWLGGEIVYGYGVGVAPTGQSRETTTEAQRPLKRLDEVLPVEVSHHPEEGAGENEEKEKEAR